MPYKKKMFYPYYGFWESLKRPIIGLAPMDGVTDFAFRHMAVTYGRPDVVFTEFTTAEGMFHAPGKILRDFEYEEKERPVVAQIYGSRPEDFYRAAHVVCELGFDGLDVNMGCPSRQVTQKLCGARLITAPDLALEILRAVRAGIADWANGQTLEDLKVPESVIATVEKMNTHRMGHSRSHVRHLIPYSLKTRIGYDMNVISWWIETVLREHPATITIHGRTLKQMYKGSASWEAIAMAVKVAQGSGTLIIGNGDLTSLEAASLMIQKTGVDGALIGRAAIGNPWIFRQPPSPEVDKGERIRAALEHASYFVSQRGTGDFKSIRKHLGGYLKNFPDAAAYRDRALRTSSLEELATVFS